MSNPNITPDPGAGPVDYLAEAIAGLRGQADQLSAQAAAATAAADEAAATSATNRTQAAMFTAEALRLSTAAGQVETATNASATPAPAT